MPRTPEAARAGPLGAALARLPLTLEAVEATTGAVRVPSYPGGARPSAQVTLAGGGHAGRGEHVAWSEAAHRDFAAGARALPRGRFALSEWAAAMARVTPAFHARAALEAAAIDLALRQAGTSCARLLGVIPAPVRYVVSHGRLAQPVAEAEPGVELKLDVDPAWDEAAWAALAATGRVAVLDWKGTGTTAEHERAHRALPAALQEDPGAGDGAWSASLGARLSFDAALTTPGALATLPARPAAVNVKPARMGGVLTALDLVAACAAGGIAVYLGGMFEVGVGRAQLLHLAALLAPEGPNDIAPIATPGDHAPRPPRLVVDPRAPGFG